MITSRVAALSPWSAGSMSTCRPLVDDEQAADRGPRGHWFVAPGITSPASPGRVAAYVAAPAPTTAAPTSVQTHHFSYQRGGSRRRAAGGAATCNRNGSAGVPLSATIPP